MIARSHPDEGRVAVSSRVMLKLKIEGMSCGHCVGAVTRALQALPGAERVREVSLERGEAVIDGTVDVSAAIHAVEEEGYTAKAAG